VSGGVCAVMLVKDEADIIETTIRHLLWHVDEVIVADNMSTDGTHGILACLADETDRVQIQDDMEVGYYQDRKTTALAMEALNRGHRWVVPCDADEIWHHQIHDISLREYLAGLGPDVQILNCNLFNHIASTDDDPAIANPVKRIRWHQRGVGMNKVICRLRPDLFINMGNHSANTNGYALTVGSQVQIRHFSWRSEEQYLRKIRNGCAAYAATNLHPMYGSGWRTHEHRSDDEIREIFREHFVIKDPDKDIEMMLDPAPLRGGA
jgi:glycosyltransferase involved in cell wall biosynthesis